MPAAIASGDTPVLQIVMLPVITAKCSQHNNWLFVVMQVEVLSCCVGSISISRVTALSDQTKYVIMVTSSKCAYKQKVVPDLRSVNTCCNHSHPCL